MRAKKEIPLQPSQRSTPPSDPQALSISDELEQLRVKGVGIHTSEGENFNNTIFGRDSAISARELLLRDPDLAYDVILTLARLQGTKYRHLSDEEPGRIHHENRRFSMWNASFSKKLPLYIASLVWGGDFRLMTTYLSMDSTQFYVLLVTEYAATYPEILNKKVIRHDRKYVSIRQSLIEACEWLSGHITRDGLVIIPKHNPFGLIHQTWKDSPTGYIHRNGQLLRVLRPIAYLEVQALTIDALGQASALLNEAIPAEAAVWKAQANVVADTTLERFWMGDRHFFSSAIDENRHGKQRVTHAMESDPGWLLMSGIFDHLSEDKKEMYISGIVKHMFSTDFLTDAGVRTRSLEYADKLSLADYHGSYTSWPIDTYMFAKGLRKQGLPALAEQLETRILNAVTLAGNSYEFFYVLGNQQVLFDPETARVKKPGADDLLVHMFPDRIIAWTVALVLGTQYSQKHGLFETKAKAGTWQRFLEDTVLSTIPDISKVKTFEELQAEYSAPVNAYLDFKRGERDFRKVVIGIYLPHEDKKG